MSADDQQSANQYESPRTESTVTTDSRPATRLANRPVALLITLAGSTVAFFGTCLPGGYASLNVLESYGFSLGGPHHIDYLFEYVVVVSLISLGVAALIGIAIWRCQRRVPIDSQEP